MPDNEGAKVNEKDWFTAQEAADCLGISQPTIFRWMKLGDLSAPRGYVQTEEHHGEGK